MVGHAARARDNHPGERATDEGPRRPTLWGWLRRYVLPATAWSFIASVIAVYALFVAIGNQDDILHGRKVAIGVTCAVESAISEQGREVIAAPSALPGPLDAFLQTKGLPDPATRRAAAKAAGDSYVEGIAQRVEQQVGHVGDGLVRPDGTLDCHRLEALSRAR